MTSYARLQKRLRHTLPSSDGNDASRTRELHLESSVFAAQARIGGRKELPMQSLLAPALLARNFQHCVDKSPEDRKT